MTPGSVLDRLDQYTATRPVAISARPGCRSHIVDRDDPTPLRRCILCGRRNPPDARFTTMSQYDQHNQAR